MTLNHKTTQNIVSTHHVIFKLGTSVESANGMVTHSIAGTVESYPFKGFVCDVVTVPRLECIDSFHVRH